MAETVGNRAILDSRSDSLPPVNILREGRRESDRSGHSARPVNSAYPVYLRGLAGSDRLGGDVPQKPAHFWSLGSRMTSLLGALSLAPFVLIGLVLFFIGFIFYLYFIFKD